MIRPLAALSALMLAACAEESAVEPLPPSAEEKLNPVEERVESVEEPGTLSEKSRGQPLSGVMERIDE